MTFWATVKEEVKGGKVVDKFTPELGIDRRGRGKKMQLYPCP